MRKSTLVFCVNLAHVRELTTVFRKFGIDARYVHSGTPSAERKALIASFKAGQYPVLVNCGQSNFIWPYFGMDFNCEIRSYSHRRRGYTKY
jgi:hypothetical protein